MTVTIYALLEPESQSVRYVGLTRRPRIRVGQYFRGDGHTKHMRNWLRSLLEKNRKPIFHLLEESDEGMAGARESFWIAKFKGEGANLLNFTTGGERDFTVSEETREKLRAARVGIKFGPMPQSHRDAISRGNKGRPRPYSSAIAKRNNEAMRGRKLTEEHKKKTGDGIRKWWTPERRLAVSQRRKGVSIHPPWTDEQRKQNSENIKEWHRNNREKFMATMSRRAKLPQDPITGRFLKKATS